MSIRSSIGNGFSLPPLKKYVTCAYFSVSAMWSCRIFCLLITSVIVFFSFFSGNAVGHSSFFGSYIVIVASVTFFDVHLNFVNPFFVNAQQSCLALSALKLNENM